MTTDTKVTHTPGPWRLLVGDEGDFILHGDSPEPHGQNMVICSRNIGTPNSAEGIANARLISAAPDLLAALKHAIEVDTEWRSRHGEYRRTPEYQESYDMAIAAIAKAEGCS